MPFLSEVPIYKAMAGTADVITTAIESLGVQVRWAGVRIQGVAPGDVNKFRPLVRALAHDDGEDLEEALSTFTVRVFCYGNMAVYVGPQAVVEWPAHWRQLATHAEAARDGRVLEAKRAPEDAEGYGASALAPGVQAFCALIAGDNANIRELEEFIRNPTRPWPGVGGDLRRVNNVLRAIGFDAWDPKGDIPAFRGAAQLRAQMKTLFETEMLQPYARATGITGHPVLVP
jgi:hypothetical protein